MSRLAKLQLIGPAVLFAVVLAAETSVYALADAPSSEMLWYINLRLFPLFQRSYYMISGYTNFPAFDLIFMALPMLLLGCIGAICRCMLLLAISSNLCFVYSAFLAYAFVLTQPHMLQASLTTIVVPAGPDFYLIAILVCSSLLSFSISHLIYVRSVRIGRR
jgi:hypothetical protein